MRKKSMYVVALLTIVFSFVGCYASMRPGGAPPGVFSSVNYPSMQNTVTKYHLTRDDYEVLGPVTVKSSSHNILMLFAFGDNGYGKLLSEARKKYPDADGFLNLYFDSRYNSLLPYFPIYQGIESTITGTAIKMKR